MEQDKKAVITVETLVAAPIEKVWEYWTEPKHITQWNNASADWHTPAAENDVRNGGKFKSTMAAKDGSSSFDFEGVYTNVRQNQLIEYTIPDDRKVRITFSESANNVRIVEVFEAESINSTELQKTGWQAILDNFKRYTESH